MARSGAGTTLQEVDTSQGLEVIHESDHGHEHGHKVGNPHIWLDPVMAMEQVKMIREALVRIDPSRESEYQSNTDVYLDRLEELDREIKERINGFRQKSFVAFHPSWAYFARRYGLIEAGIIEAAPGREPTPGEIMAIIKRVHEAGVKAVFAEPQLNPKAAYVIADEINGQVLFLDPIGSPDQEERSTYLKLMRYNLGVMEQGMGNSS
jgi:ABC-type Zn uptake system ZnuABC Zn-binding protein ZnuA